MARHPEFDAHRSKRSSVNPVRVRGSSESAPLDRTTRRAHATRSHRSREAWLLALLLLILLGLDGFGMVVQKLDEVIVRVEHVFQRLHDPGADTDATVLLAVSGALGRNGRLGRVEPRVSRGLVTLSGRVADDFDRASAILTCERVPGVRGVVDRMKVELRTGPAEDGASP